MDGTSRLYDTTLPVPAYNHNLLAVNDTHLVLINVGETVDRFVDENAWIYDTVQDVWTTLPRMSVARSRAVAGINHNFLGNVELVVAGGMEEVMNLESG